MLVKALEVGYLQTNCYLVTDEDTMDTAIIDPGAVSNVILDYVESNRLKVRGILVTHGHFDHCMGLEEVQAALGCPVYMSHKDLTEEINSAFYAGWEVDPPDETVFVSEGDEIECGSLTFDVLETPGHTPGGADFPLPGLPVHRGHPVPHVLRPVRFSRQQRPGAEPLPGKAPGSPRGL